jgi:hypothetical protein
MIQWIALAVAVDANSKAGQARSTANKARHEDSDSSMVIIRPVDLILVPTGEPKVPLLFGLISHTPQKKVLAKEPWATLSIKKRDIINIKEKLDEDGQKYCVLNISEYAEIFRRKNNYDGPEMITSVNIIGSIEEVAGAIGGV